MDANPLHAPSFSLLVKVAHPSYDPNEKISNYTSLGYSSIVAKGVTLIWHHAKERSLSKRMTKYLAPFYRPLGEDINQIPLLILSLLVLVGPLLRNSVRSNV